MQKSYASGAPEDHIIRIVPDDMENADSFERIIEGFLSVGTGMASDTKKPAFWIGAI